MSEQIRRCVGSIIFVPDRRRFGDLYVRIRTIIRLFLILAQKNPAVFYLFSYTHLTLPTTPYV